MDSDFHASLREKLAGLKPTCGGQLQWPCSTSGETTQEGRQFQGTSEKEATSCSLPSRCSLDQLHSFDKERGTATDDQIAPAHGAALSEARGCPELGFYAGLVCDLLPDKELRGHTLADPISKSMARPSRRPSSDSLAVLPHPGHHQRTDRPVSETQTSTGGRTDQNSCHKESDHSGGFELPVSSPALPAATTGNWSESIDLLGHHGVSFGAPTTGLPGTSQLRSVLCDGFSSEQRRSCALEAPDLLAERLALQPDETTGGILTLASHWSSPETTRATTLADCSGHPPAPTPSRGETLKAQWIEKIHILQCGNEGNWCYANAGLVTLIWTLLHATSFDEYTFGTAWEAVRSVELASHPSLAGLFEGQTSSDQRDIAEFTSEVLAWCKSSRASQAWERRFVTPDGTCCLEKGGDFQPVALVHLFELDAEQTTLAALLVPWLHCHSMPTALTQRGGPKVFFLDRLIDCARLLGHFHHVDFLVPFHLPFFVNDGLDLNWEEHVTVAAVAHLGDSHRGHFRALLREPATGELWICDDNRPPEAIQHVPEFFYTRSVLFWTLPSRAMDKSGDELAPSMPDFYRPLNPGMDTSSWTTPSFTLTQVAREQLGSDATPVALLPPRPRWTLSPTWSARPLADHMTHRSCQCGMTRTFVSWARVTWLLRIRHLAPHLLQLGGNRELRLMLQLLLSRRLRRPRTKR